ncbi:MULTISPECIES: hypothetical protein [unclassified Brenneria]|uniref:hypothetical protein n=1 Tax=unclassified Brenneria TaxID=2634434 RepID=UPI0029C27DCB|nr:MULTISPECIES: hypothetical protein [unclassified Brenneria]MDX5627138.1 hypothetical protein [Brenneria sp. L3-3Z]MDX5694707.1 hypothetical protein [Brenneria sp. L4-2C]
MSESNGNMPKKKIVIITVLMIFLLLFFFRNKIFLPIGELVSFSVSLPKEMAISPLKVMYRSETCKVSKPRADGGSYKVPGYYYKEVIFSDSANGYKYDIPLNGWGVCLWALSNVTVDFEYRDLIIGGEKIGSGAVFVFDNNAPQFYNGKYKEITGDVVLEKNYFPWVSKIFRDKNEKYLRMFGGDVNVVYKTFKTKNITIIPISNPDLMVYSEWPVDNESREFRKYIYPDGSITVTADGHPDYEELIRIKSDFSKD